jgi:hypothetical protein
MIILYRGKDGRFISARSAGRRKPGNVMSELREKNKSLGVKRGYFSSVKKLTRVILPQLKLKTKKRPQVTPIKVRMRGKSRFPEPDIEAEYYEELDEGELSEYEDEWRDEFSEDSDLQGLSHMDDLEELLEDEDEWYHE